ncbi:MAG: hypothetical protein HY319_18610 [Armatimonadetes bacterium]|nr:hypothetical protein [Armatimonadota bacterium]
MRPILLRPRSRGECLSGCCLAAAVVCLVLLAACIGLGIWWWRSSHPAPAPTPGATPVQASPAPPVATSDPSPAGVGGSVQRWLSGARLKEPAVSGSLVLYPIELSSPTGPPVAVAGALNAREYASPYSPSTGPLLPTEAPGSNGNVVVLQNPLDRPLLVPGGWLLVGGRQDRCLPHDLMLEPQSGPMTTEIYCVEEGRSFYRAEDLKGPDADRFRADLGLASLTVRAALDQKGTWQAIEALRAAVGPALAPKTSLYTVQEQVPNLEALSRPLLQLPQQHPGMTGAVVQLGREVLAVEVFSSREAFLQLWPDLLRSYVLQATADPGRAVPDSGMATRFLQEAPARHWSELSQDRARVLMARDGGWRADAVSWDGQLVHAFLIRPRVVQGDLKTF